MTRQTLNKFFKLNDMTPAIKHQDVVLFLPYMLIDMAYELYQKDIKPVDCKHRVKHIQKQLGQLLTDFFKQFFTGFSVDEQCEITDLMDGLEEAIHNDIVRYKLTVMNAVKAEDVDIKKRIASGFTCSVLMETATRLYNYIYSRNTRVCGIYTSIIGNQIMEGTANIASRWTGLYARECGINQIDIDNVIDSIYETIVAKACRWARKQKIEEAAA